MPSSILCNQVLTSYFHTDAFALTPQHFETTPIHFLCPQKDFTPTYLFPLTTSLYDHSTLQQSICKSISVLKDSQNYAGKNVSKFKHFMF